MISYSMNYLRRTVLNRDTKDLFQRYHWTYQCSHCFIKSGHSYTGTSAGASSNAPTCCGGELMNTIRGNKVKG